MTVYEKKKFRPLPLRLYECQPFVACRFECCSDVDQKCDAMDKTKTKTDFQKQLVFFQSLLFTFAICAG